jgi:hypothetical protein
MQEYQVRIAEGAQFGPKNLPISRDRTTSREIFTHGRYPQVGTVPWWKDYLISEHQQLVHPYALLEFSKQHRLSVLTAEQIFTAWADRYGNHWVLMISAFESRFDYSIRPYKLGSGVMIVGAVASEPVSKHKGRNSKGERK